MSNGEKWRRLSPQYAEGKFGYGNSPGKRIKKRQRVHPDPLRLIPPAWWAAWTDGGCWPNPGGEMGVGAVLQDPWGARYRFGACAGPGTNNLAEFAGVLLALWELKRMGADRIVFFSDSKLVLGAFFWKWKLKAPHLAQMAEPILGAMCGFKEVRGHLIPRKLNEQADALAEKGVKHGQHLPPELTALLPDLGYLKIIQK